jgi:hypothetical protein
MKPTEHHDGLRLVTVESPFTAPTQKGRKENLTYLFECMKDCLARGESPYASHALFTQFLDDDLPDERATGIAAGLAWQRAADAVVVYVDRGISAGMREGIERAKRDGKPVELRTLANGGA